MPRARIAKTRSLGALAREDVLDLGARVGAADAAEREEQEAGDRRVVLAVVGAHERAHEVDVAGRHQLADGERRRGAHLGVAVAVLEHRDQQRRGRPVAEHAERADRRRAHEPRLGALARDGDQRRRGVAAAREADRLDHERALLRREAPVGDEIAHHRRERRLAAPSTRRARRGRASASSPNRWAAGFCSSAADAKRSRWYAGGRCSRASDAARSALVAHASLLVAEHPEERVGVLGGVEQPRARERDRGRRRAQRSSGSCSSRPRRVSTSGAVERPLLVALRRIEARRGRAIGRGLVGVVRLGGIDRGRLEDVVVAGEPEPPARAGPASGTSRSSASALIGAGLLAGGVAGVAHLGLGGAGIGGEGRARASCRPA
jgi:hypothetical protein